MASINELERMKTAVQNAKDASSRASGALDQIMKRLKAEFQCDTLEEAHKLLTKLERDTTKAAENFDRAMATFKKDHPDYAG